MAFRSVAVVAVVLSLCGVSGVAPAPAPTTGHFYPGLSTTAPGGSAFGGLALSIVTGIHSMPAGSPWSVRVEIRNVSALRQTVMGPVMSCGFEFVFLEQATRNIRTANPSDFCDVYQVGPKYIPPGHSGFLQATFKSYDLDFLREGTWYVWARANLPEDYDRGTPRRFLTSNGLTLRVLPGVASPMPSPETGATPTPRT